MGRKLLVGGREYQVIGLVKQQGRTLGQNQDDLVADPARERRCSSSARAARSTSLIRAKGGVPGVEASVDEVRGVLRALRHTPSRTRTPSAS